MSMGPGAGPSGGPMYHAISAPAVPMHGDEDNPVYSWHNQFLKVSVGGTVVGGIVTQ